MVFGAANQLMDYTECMTRQRISEIPDGDYTAEGWLDDDGRNRDQRLKVKVTVRVRGDEVQVGLTGSADQTPTPYNVHVEGSTKVATYAGFRKLLLDAATSDTRVLLNEGSFRPIRVTAPLAGFHDARVEDDAGPFVVAAPCSHGR
jgi:N-methylhydantoinase B